MPGSNVPFFAMDLATDIRVVEAAVEFEDHTLRTPLTLSTGTITDICQATARVRVEDPGGRFADGWGAIFLGDLWAWPTDRVSSPDRVRTMKALCEVLASGLPKAACEYAHPLEHGMHLLEMYVPDLARPASQVMDVAEPMPPLAAAVCFSPLDAAMHDAFGRLHNISAYRALDQTYLPETLDRWLGDDGAGRHVSEFFAATPAGRLPGWHLVGKNDPLTREEVAHPIGDGLPESLDEWIEKEGIFCFKIKISGTATQADVERVSDIFRLAATTHGRMRTNHPVHLEVDSNEACPDAETVVEFLRRLQEASPRAFDALLFVEQPVGRDLAGQRIDMSPVSAIKPVLIDEGLQSLRSLPLARDLGWSGVAVKTCKGHSPTLLSIAWCGLTGMPFEVVDLTNPGLAAIHAASLAAHSHPMMGIELNCRQFVPDANRVLAEHMPGLSRMTGGYFDVSQAGSAGLGYPPGVAQ